MNKVELYIATHKEFDGNLADYCRKMQVNTANTHPWNGYLHDNEGDNISKLNPYYCELTALYRLWKGCRSEIKGLAHYRRYFGNTDSRKCTIYYPRYSGFQDLKRRMLSEKRIEALLDQHDIILLVPHNPFPATAFEALSKFVSLTNIQLMIRVIYDCYPEYIDSMWDVLYAHQISYCNMFIASAAITDPYCEWLFDVLSKIDARIPKDEDGNPPARIYGYYAEVLLNIYVRKHHLRVKHMDLLVAADLSALGRVRQRIKNVVLDAYLAMGIVPGWSGEDRKRLYTSRSHLMRGERVPPVDGANYEASVVSYYQNAGALHIEWKKTEEEMPYLKALMNSSVSNECYIAIGPFDHLASEDLKAIEESVETIRKRERSESYTILTRAYVLHRVDVGVERELLMKGIRLEYCD